MKRRTIFKALMALMVIMLGVNFNAEAQLGGLINAAKNKTKQNKAKNELEQQEKELAEHNKAMVLAIPQPDANGSKVLFSIGNENVASWNPATNELTITTTRGGNTSGSVYKVDPATGNVTDSKGASKGSLNTSGTIESPNLGKLHLRIVKEEMPIGNYETGVKYIETITGYYVYAGSNTILGAVERDKIPSPNYLGFDGSVSGGNVNPLITAYVFYGLMLTEKEVAIKSLGYDPDKTYTTKELEDKIRWKDDATEAEIKKMEEGLTYSDDRVRGSKVAAIGLLREWRRLKYTKNEGEWNEYSYFVDDIGYWVVYELSNGKNKVAIYSLTKNAYNKGLTERGECAGFYDVTDWERK